MSIKSIYGKLLEWVGLANVPAAVNALAGLKGSVGQIVEISGTDAQGGVTGLTAVNKPAGDGGTVPTKVSAFENDAGYQTEAQVNALLAAFPTFDIQVVAQLPAEGVEKTIYLVPFADDSGSYLEYLYVNGAWEVIGSGKDSGENVNLTSPDGSVWKLAITNEGEVYGIKQQDGTGGGNEEPEPVTYSVTNDLTNAVTSNEAASIESGAEYNAIIAAEEGYTLSRVTVTMGGVDITATAYADGIITIPAVTGDIIVTVVAEVTTIYSEVQWLDTAYGIGDNTVAKYNGWAPGCAHYDPDLGKVIFLQCHATGHAGALKPSQLWAIDPYNVMDAELLATFDVINNKVPLTLAIYNGKYYIQSVYRTYVSEDHGKTWTTSTPVTAPDRCYGLTIIDDVMYAGNDAFADDSNGLYYISTDWGNNWQVKTFDFADAYAGELTCSEASFVKFNGNIYAALRREENPGLLAVQDPATGVWSVISETMPNVSSDVYFYAAADTLCFCAIDRPARNLHLGTIGIGDSGVTINTVKTYDFNGISDHGDFHTPTYVYGPDFQMVTLMCGGTSSEYAGAINIAIVGYADETLNRNPSYTITKAAQNNANITAEPYVGTSPYVDGDTPKFQENSISNLAVKHCNTHPLDADGNVYLISPTPGLFYTVGTAHGYMAWDGFEHNGQLYSCFVAGMKSEGKAWTGLKIMSKACKDILINVSDIGSIVPEGGVFDYAFYSKYSSGAHFVTMYAITAEYVEPGQG